MSKEIPELQPRLRRLAALVPSGSRLADIGTDHGYIPVALLGEGRIRSAIAADIGEEPLNHARRTAERYGMTEGVTFRLCDGLAGIDPAEADTILIAGMGGETIAGILAAAPWLREGAYTLLLQPMTRQEYLRQWLSEHGFSITEEQLVTDKETLYNILIVAPKPSPPLTEMDCWAGVQLENDPLWGDYLRAQAAKLLRAAEGLEKARDCCSRTRAAERRALAAALLQKKEEWTHADHQRD